MIDYDAFTQYAPPASSREERDAWFEEKGYLVPDLLRVGQEVATFRLSGLEDGAQLGSQELTLLMVSVFLFGVELAIRAERDEKVA